MATHSNILAWKIPWTEKPSRLQYSPWGHKESDMIERLSTHTSVWVCVCVCVRARVVHFAVHLKLTRHWQPTTL